MTLTGRTVLLLAAVAAAALVLPGVTLGASPRAAVHLLAAARAAALLRGRDFVTPDDIKAVAPPALAHRLMLRPELWVQRVRAEDVVAEILSSVPTPAAEDVVAAPE